MSYSNNVYFAIGTGRCGTKFLSEIIGHEPNIASSHERDPLADTFQRFCNWYNIPIDNTGFLVQKEKRILEDLKTNDISFESSAYLSLSIKELFKHFNAKFILLVRSPEKMIESYLTKGWYLNNPELEDSSKVPSYQNHKYFHHFLGRTLPKGSEFEKWKNWSRVGKLAWFWSTLNKEVISAFHQLPAENYRIQKLEEINYDSYRSLLKDFFLIESNLSKKEFDEIADSKPNSLNTNYHIDQWSPKEMKEFLNNSAELVSFFNYKWSQ